MTKKQYRSANMDQDYHEEDLLQPLDAVLVPGGVDVYAARFTANQVLCQ